MTAPHARRLRRVLSRERVSSGEWQMAHEVSPHPPASRMPSGPHTRRFVCHALRGCGMGLLTRGVMMVVKELGLHMM